MRYSPEIESALVAQIAAEPTRPVVLPEWAYWAGEPQPWIYRDGMPVPLMRHLYEVILGGLAETAGLQNPPHVDARNVNPHLAIVKPSKRTRLVCPNGHTYTEDDWIDGVGHQCQTCRAAKLLGTPSITDINRAKTDCPQGHPYTEENLVRLKNGRRRCKQCHRENQARYIASLQEEE